MKKLLLIRHAKAEKESLGIDIDRPLRYTGIQDSTFMAERLIEQSIIPQIIISSPALRTKTTAEIFADNLKLPNPEFNQAIYQASEQTWVKVINKLPNQYDFIAVVGHNPGISQILDYLTGEMREVHTCTTALIEFETDDWSTISSDSGKLTYFSWPNG